MRQCDRENGKSWRGLHQFCTALFVAVIVKKPPYNAERYSSRPQSAMMPLNDGERNTRFSTDAPSSTQYSDRLSGMNVQGVGLPTVRSSFDRPSHNYTPSVSRTTHGAPQHSGTASYCQRRTAATGRSFPHSTPLYSNTSGTQYPATATHLSRSLSSETRLSSSSGTAGYVYPRPLPSDPALGSSSSRRTLPHTAYRMS